MLLPLDKDDSNWEVMSSMSSRRDKGYSRVMTRLLKKSNQLSMVGKHLSTERFVFSGFYLFQPLLMQDDNTEQ